MASKGIWVSKEILHDKKLSMCQRFILAEIGQLSSLDKGCFASNRHFAELLGVTKTCISNAINKLKKDGYIEVDDKQTKRNMGRIITIHDGVGGVHDGVESKENKQTNKQYNNQKSEYELFIKDLKSKSNIPSKITSTKDGKKLFNTIDNKQQLVKDYISHQLDKKQFSQRITAFMEDYNNYDKQQGTKQFYNLPSGCI